METVVEHLNEPEFIVYLEPAPPDIIAEFRDDLEYLQNKVNAALGIPAEFINPKRIDNHFSINSKGKICWLEPKYETQPCKLRFKSLRKLEFKKATSLINL